MKKPLNILMHNLLVELSERSARLARNSAKLREHSGELRRRGTAIDSGGKSSDTTCYQLIANEHGKVVRK